MSNTTPASEDEKKEDSLPALSSAPLLSVTNVLRQGISGGVFLMSYILAFKPGDISGYTAKINDAPWTFLGLCVIMGVAIYSGHRAITNPLLERLVYAFYADLKLRKNDWGHKWIASYVVPERPLRMARRRWLFISKLKPFQSHVHDWGDYIHLQYCSSQAIFLGVVSAFVTKYPYMQFDAHQMLCVSCLISLSLVSLVGGFFSDVRKLSVEMWLYSAEKGLVNHLLGVDPTVRYTLDQEISDSGKHPPII